MTIKEHSVVNVRRPEGSFGDDAEALSSGGSVVVVAETQLARKVQRLVRRAADGSVDDLLVAVCDDAIVLSGRCRSFTMKRICQEAIMAEFKGWRLVNGLQVVDAKDFDSLRLG